MERREKAPVPSTAAVSASCSQLYRPAATGFWGWATEGDRCEATLPSLQWGVVRPASDGTVLWPQASSSLLRPYLDWTPCCWKGLGGAAASVADGVLAATRRKASSISSLVSPLRSRKERLADSAEP